MCSFPCPTRFYRLLPAIYLSWKWDWFPMVRSMCVCRHHSWQTTVLSLRMAPQHRVSLCNSSSDFVSGCFCQLKCSSPWGERSADKQHERWGSTGQAPDYLLVCGRRGNEQEPVAIGGAEHRRHQQLAAPYQGGAPRERAIRGRGARGATACARHDPLLHAQHCNQSLCGIPACTSPCSHAVLRSML